MTIRIFHILRFQEEGLWVLENVLFGLLFLLFATCSWVDVLEIHVVWYVLLILLFVLFVLLWVWLSLFVRFVFCLLFLLFEFVAC